MHSPASPSSASTTFSSWTGCSVRIIPTFVSRVIPPSPVTAVWFDSSNNPAVSFSSSPSLEGPVSAVVADPSFPRSSFMACQDRCYDASFDVHRLARAHGCLAAPASSSAYVPLPCRSRPLPFLFTMDGSNKLLCPTVLR
uniref:Predicted protein n=1 Tax=Hordeum vulgare subsp. vulgare TaxID=112509 RepID=F2CR99_HORVV|nr:predicted protein [Hordeum vulgare subsp. vulgare]